MDEGEGRSLHGRKAVHGPADLGSQARISLGGSLAQDLWTALAEGEELSQALFTAMAVGLTYDDLVEPGSHATWIS